ncbi:MAG: endonuclease domain-containing protein [Mycobacteriales bacterium]
MRNPATCHPERVNFGHGLCESYWKKDWRRKNPKKAARARKLQREAYRRWRKKHPQARRLYYQANKAQINEKSSAWKKAHPERTKDFYRKSVHGLTAETYQAALKKQRNRCACCGRKFTKEKGKGPHSDHCHDTLDFRGLLCRDCNLGLGYFKDDLKILRAAIRYLVRSRNS